MRKCVWCLITESAYGRHTISDVLQLHVCTRWSNNTRTHIRQLLTSVRLNFKLWLKQSHVLLYNYSPPSLSVSPHRHEHISAPCENIYRTWRALITSYCMRWIISRKHLRRSFPFFSFSITCIRVSTLPCFVADILGPSLMANTKPHWSEGPCEWDGH